MWLFLQNFDFCSHLNRGFLKKDEVSSSAFLLIETIGKNRPDIMKACKKLNSSCIEHFFIACLDS